MSYLADFKTQLIFVVFTFIGFILYSFKRRYDYWKDRGMVYAGISKDIFFISNKHRCQILDELYREYAPHPYIGFFQVMKPHILVRDLELIRTILIRDFSHFPDHGQGSMDSDPYLANGLFNLRGKKWRDVRAKFSPIFTVAKLRRMSTGLDGCIKLLDNYLEAAISKSADNEIEVRDLMAKFAMDVIGVCVLGFECKALEDDEGLFRQLARKIFAPIGRWKTLIMTISNSINPKFNNWLNVKFYDPAVAQVFTSLITDAIKNRKENENKRRDFLHLLADLYEEEQKLLQSGQVTDADKETLFDEILMTANVLIFFIAGFDTTASSMSFILYELATHPEHSEKLYEEIIRVKEAHGGVVNYDTLKDMHFMDAFVSESLRLHPTASWLDRICTEDFKDPNSSLIIRKGQNVVIPMYALHLDPQYFPDPNKFDPYRFTEENKSKIIPGSYFPFGDGPRICIGNRFALLEIKTALTHMISKYTIEPTANTEIPIKLNLKAYNVTPKTVFLRFKKREK